jgi:peptidylprolyl isomerase
MRGATTQTLRPIPDRSNPWNATRHNYPPQQPATPTKQNSPTVDAMSAAAQPEKPSVSVPAGNPPTTLVIEDLIVGDGHEAKAGNFVDVHYVGVSWSTGKEFDSSWSRNEVFQFPLGAGHVIQGWDQGVQGMRIGGRRQLTIPPEMGYGARGAGGVIKPNETLIFVVDLFDAQ